MKEPHLLRASANPRSIKRNLGHILDPQALAAIENDIAENARGLLALAEDHLSHAGRFRKQKGWRQAISRLYYAAYNAFRAVRLYTDGHYSTDGSDHKRLNTLPSDFPERETYANRLQTLREDRNLCDYDHAATVSDLIASRQEHAALVSQFIADVKRYLSTKGLQ